MGHVNEKCIQKLHKDGLFDSFDFELYEICESYLGKMTNRSLFTGLGERASDLLRLVHSYVCVPMSNDQLRHYFY